MFFVILWLKDVVLLFCIYVSSSVDFSCLVSSWGVFDAAHSKLQKLRMCLYLKLQPEGCHMYAYCY